MSLISLNIWKVFSGGSRSPKGRKTFFLETGPPPFSKSLDDHPPPPLPSLSLLTQGLDLALVIFLDSSSRRKLTKAGNREKRRGLVLELEDF